jgi:hypothetical protein
MTALVDTSPAVADRAARRVSNTDGVRTSTAVPRAPYQPVARRSLKHRWSLGHNYLGGITAGMWWRLLRDNRFAVDPAYWHRAAFISLASLYNSFFRWSTSRRYADAVAQVQMTRPPLFVLGHWRSGTTLLHNLLAANTEQFAFANTYQVVNPLTFLATEEANTRRFARLIPDKRPMDNMELGFHTPQEDEFAPLLMTLLSLYLGISFPRREQDYACYLTFRGVPQAQIDEWKAALLWFCKSLTLKHGRPLVLKSPPHTARIRLLLELFPDARFVHVCRNPYDVFQSQQHYFETAMWYTYLQRPDVTRIDDGILTRYTTIYDAYFDDRVLIPAGRLHELRFEDLERDPVGELHKLYEALDLPGFADFEPHLQAYVATLAGYRKNTFAPLSDTDRFRVAAAWQRGFHEFDYPA